jgi:dTDP-4-amino-4,6-dideoxygalactose transaminase
MVGYNYRMEGFQGAVLDLKLKYLDRWNEARRAHARRYIERLTGVRGLGLPLLDDVAQSVFHLFVIEAEQRDRLAEQLKVDGIQTGLHYPIPVHLQPPYRDLGYTHGSFPYSERLANRCLSLPMYPELTDVQVDYVCERLRAALETATAVRGPVSAVSC